MGIECPLKNWVLYWSKFGLTIWLLICNLICFLNITLRIQGCMIRKTRNRVLVTCHCSHCAQEIKPASLWSTQTKMPISYFHYLSLKFIILQTDEKKIMTLILTQNTHTKHHNSFHWLILINLYEVQKLYLIDPISEWITKYMVTFLFGNLRKNNHQPSKNFGNKKGVSNNR